MLIVVPECALDFPWDMYSFGIADWSNAIELWPAATSAPPPSTIRVEIASSSSAATPAPDASMPDVLTPPPPPPPAPSASPDKRGKVESWVYDHMKSHRSEIFAHDYVARLHARNPFGVSEGRIRNIVGRYRQGEFRLVK
jgi:hypothetical protein